MSDEIRHNIRFFIQERDLKIAKWCRDAGVNPATLRKFLDGGSNDFGVSKLHALAKSENVSMDVLVGRSRALGKLDVLNRCYPLVIKTGATISLSQLSEQADVPLQDLRDVFGSMAAVCAECYLHWRQTVLNDYEQVKRPKATLKANLALFNADSIKEMKKVRKLIYEGLACTLRLGSPYIEEYQRTAIVTGRLIYHRLVECSSDVKISERFASSLAEDLHDCFISSVIKSRPDVEMDSYLKDMTVRSTNLIRIYEKITIVSTDR
jgi:DNA-binding transcriptional MerR regulator